MSLGKTAWVDKNLRQYWDKIGDEVSPDLLPRLEPHEKFYVEEYGCGHYGCVMPTNRPGIVAKLTSDPTEAYFVAAALQIGEFPEGIVRYTRIFQLEGASHRKRPLFVLWREEAHDIGFLMGRTANYRFETDLLDDYERRARREFENLLVSFKNNAAKVRMILERSTSREKTLAQAKELEQWAYESFSRGTASHLKGAHAVAMGLRVCEVTAEEMENTYLADLVGGAFTFYLEHGLLLADVHYMNVGKVDRPDYQNGAIVITDPGHAVALDPKWDQIPIEAL